jgi:hypothetical protein
MRIERVISGLALVLASASLLFSVLLSSRTTNALCAFRGDLEQQVEQSKTFLLKHPHGALGYTPKQIRDAQRNRQRTIDALSSLSCG